ncbi:MmgE/PrpD family protein [Desulfoscipio sp. XC116]|uniref:MmgE/PrpD family protein n=1 Tax=Desulfoscipio sp. XC116 TaxID=3144975 RepID=UPI00325AAEE8
MQDMINDISSVYAKLGYKDFSSTVVDTTKKFILDTLGCGLAGTKAPGSAEVHALFASFGGKEEATLLGFGNKLPSPNAAFVNSVVSHALDLDDTLDDAAMHCYVSAWPAALALAEARKASGRQLITAVILGVDMSCRLGTAINTPLSWIRTATCGSFGAAAAAAKILNLSEEKTRNAFGVAYSQTSGNAQCLLDGGLSKRLQPAFSTKAGVLSSLLAEIGITGARNVLEGKFGFFNLYERGYYDRQKCLAGLGEDFFGMKLSIKPYPSCRMTHSSIDAALAIKEKSQFSFKEVDRVEVFVAKMCREMVGQPFEVRQNPQVDAQFSIPYTVSVALAKGKPFIDDFSESVIRDRERKMMAKKINVLVDDTIDARDLKPATINVYLNNGEVLKHRIDVLKGHPENPLSWDECIDKFKKCAAAGIKQYSKDQVDRLIDTILSLENIDNAGEIFGRIFGE